MNFKDVFKTWLKIMLGAGLLTSLLVGLFFAVLHYTTLTLVTSAFTVSIVLALVYSKEEE